MNTGLGSEFQFANFRKLSGEPLTPAQSVPRLPLTINSKTVSVSIDPIRQRIILHHHTYSPGHNPVTRRHKRMREGRILVMTSRSGPSLALIYGTVTGLSQSLENPRVRNLNVPTTPNRPCQSGQPQNLKPSFSWAFGTTKPLLGWLFPFQVHSAKETIPDFTAVVPQIIVV